MELYDAPPGYSDPDVPEGYSDPAKPEKKGLAKLWEYAKKKDAEMRSRPMKDRLISAIGNTTVGGIPDLKQVIDAIPEDWSTTKSVLSAVNSVLPSQSVAGIAKGASDLALGPAQLAAHAAGIGKGRVDSAVNATSDYYKRNFNKSTSGEVAGQALASLLPGSSASKLVTIAKSAAAPVVFTPETNLKDDPEYWSRKGTEAGVGAAVGAAIPLVGSAVRPVAKGINKLKDRLANAGSVAEVQGELTSKFGGLTPGQYLKAKATEIYEEPLARHDELMDKLMPLAGDRKTNYENTLMTIDRILGEHNNNVSQMQPEQASQLAALRDRIFQSIQKTSASTKSNGVGMYLNNELPTVAKTVGGSDISNDLGGLIQAYQDLGKPLGNNINKHGSRLSRGVLQDVRAAMLEDMHNESSHLGGIWDDARAIFRDEVVPLFDKKHGGNLLTTIRDAWDPDDQLQKILQGGLRDAKVNKIQKIASGSASDPLIWQAIENATQGAHGRPGAFASSLEKALPALEAISTPEQAKQLRELIFQAKAGKVLGIAGEGMVTPAMAGVGAAAGSLVGAPGWGAGVGASVGGHIAGASHFSPALSGQGMAWRKLQDPGFREKLAKLWNLPVGSPELDSKFAQFLAQQSGRSQQPSLVE